VLAEAGFEVVRADCRSEDDVIGVAERADALIVQWAPITARVLARLPRCRFISRLGIGWDMIDVPAASKRGIAVANTPDYCIEEVAAHTIALALASSRGVLSLDHSIRRQDWAVAANAPPVNRPSSSAFAVIGFGRIGSRVAEIARAIGFQVVVHDPHVPEAAIAGRGFRAAALDAALSEARVVSLHVPLTDETHHLIDRQALERMDGEAVLVNTSRGALVDEAALAAALHSGAIAGAALDVFEREPIPADSALRGAPNLVLTPHAAWYSKQALDELPLQAARQVVDFFAGTPPASILNPEYAQAPRTTDA
jgi:D-3-phosphoglycerate dehydrogenase